MSQTTQTKGPDEWLVVVNPNAGLKKAESDWDHISNLLKKNKLLFTSVFTERRGHAIELTQEMIRKGFRNILVAGGDGTLNEVVNGIFLQQEVPSSAFTLAMIPIGTGNDWCRMYQIPFDYEEAVEVVLKGKTFIQDVGKVTFQGEHQQEVRYLINNAGMGYDALVAKKTNLMKDRGKGGAFLYMYNLFTGLLFFQFTHAKITVDDKTFYHRVFSMNVGICQFNGAGMKQLPLAIPDDGLFDITVIRRIGRIKVIRNVKNLYDGSFIELPQVLTFKGKNVEVESEPPFLLEVDGESLGYSPLHFEILPGAIRVVVK